MNIVKEVLLLESQYCFSSEFFFGYKNWFIQDLDRSHFLRTDCVHYTLLRHVPDMYVQCS